MLMLNLISPSQIESVFRNLYSSVQGVVGSLNHQLQLIGPETLDSKAADLISWYMHQNCHLSQLPRRLQTEFDSLLHTCPDLRQVGKTE